MSNLVFGTEAYRAILLVAILETLGGAIHASRLGRALLPVEISVRARVKVGVRGRKAVFRLVEPGQADEGEVRLLHATWSIEEPAMLSIRLGGELATAGSSHA